MKSIVALLLLVSMLSCKNNSEKIKPNYNQESTLETQPFEEEIIVDAKEDIELNKRMSIEIKQKELIEKPDEKEQLQELLIEKSYIKEEDEFSIDFHYPLLNEKLKASYANFNEYINDSYVNIIGTEAGILEDKGLICDTIRTNRYKEKRFIDYKIYNVNDQLVSVLFYKENFYSGTLHPTYSFDCLNFDLNRSVFMNYDDFFVEGSEEELRNILNEVITNKINSGDMYYDCWEVSEEDFFEYKDNFVLDDTSVEYYFDDCVVCPSYTGSYSVEIPLEQLLPVLKRYDVNPLVF
ncbi:MAG: DUF3298 domain-containing protein [Flavobacteriaceae bacterium]|nr:DUF3298 domain-containing protein [Flavobacteriaceae bacterium]